MKNTILICILFILYACSLKNKKEYAKDITTDFKHGLIREYYPNGQLEAEINYEYGKLNGQIKTYHQNGQLAELSHWQNDSLNGPAKYYYENGILAQESYYKSGKLEKEEIRYYNNGRIKSKILYKDGLLWELIANYDSLGNQLDEMTIVSGSGILNTYYPNGTIESKTEFEAGLPNGKSLSYHENGNVKMNFQVTDGKKNGYFSTYHQNGKLFIKGLYEHNKIVGTQKVYNDQGNLISTISYKQNFTTEDSAKLEQGIEGTNELFELINLGILHGPSITYFNNGQIKSEKYFFYGIQDSVFREYYGNGTIQTDIFFDDNYELNKRYEKRYDEQGNIVKSETFHKRDNEFKE